MNTRRIDAGEGTLLREIAGLSRMIAASRMAGGPGVRSVVAYLRQLRRSRIDKLTRLRPRGKAMASEASPQTVDCR